MYPSSTRWSVLLFPAICLFEEIVATGNYFTGRRGETGDGRLWALVHGYSGSRHRRGWDSRQRFAVSRMLAMLTEMKLVPHSHFGMPGSIQKHTLVYTIVLGLLPPRSLIYPELRHWASSFIW